MIVAGRGHPFPGSLYAQQSKAAGLLHTTEQYGTDFSAMRPALNGYLPGVFYDDQTLPDAPSSDQITQFEGEVVYDTNYGTGWPIAANEDAIPANWLENQHLVDGHGNPTTIMHWLAGAGYTHQGGVTVYQDPGWGESSGPYHWGSGKFVTALGGRGYVF